LSTLPMSSKASISSTASSHQTKIKPPHDDRLDTRFDYNSRYSSKSLFIVFSPSAISENVIADG
ncbi:MAG: hypothetical protein AB3N28_13255, partial [Kordiimonas sp.]